MKKYVIGKNCSPSKIIDYSEFKVKQVLISYSKLHQYYYGEVIDNFDSILIKCIDNREITFNKRFLVSIEDVNLVKVIFDETDWENFSEKKVDKKVKVDFFKFYANEEYSIDENKRNDSYMTSKIVYRYEEVEKQ